MSAAGGTEVQDFYQDCEVLVTGGTGFLGKLAVEKVLRSCPGVRRVYLLVRPKKGLSVEQRKEVLLDNVVFERMKREQPDSVDKIVVVPGDCSAPRLGLSDSDYHDLTQHVNIVLHLAANVRFDESLKAAVTINTKGTQEAIKLCRDCISLKAAVFVSTAYSYYHRQVIGEKFYEPPMPLEDAFALMDKFSESELDILGPRMIYPWPNAYVFSKAIAENVILTQGKDLPLAIVRPSMVVSTLKEPIMGWVDNMYGPIAFAIGVGCGVLHVNYGNKHTAMSIVPADIVTNCILVSALSANTRSQDVIPIYNVTTSDDNPVTIREFSDILTNMIKDFPMKTAIWYPSHYLVKDYCVYMFLAFFLHFLPGCLLDLLLRLQGKKPMMLKIYRKMQKHALLMNYFSLLECTFVCENSKNLYKQLSGQEKEIFAADMGVINWDQYITAAGIESRKYLLNESLDSLDQAKSRSRRFYVAHTLMKITLSVFALYILISFVYYKMKIFGFM